MLECCLSAFAFILLEKGLLNAKVRPKINKAKIQGILIKEKSPHGNICFNSSTNLKQVNDILTLKSELDKIITPKAEL